MYVTISSPLITIVSTPGDLIIFMRCILCHVTPDNDTHRQILIECWMKMGCASLKVSNRSSQRYSNKRSVKSVI